MTSLSHFYYNFQKITEIIFKQSFNNWGITITLKGQKLGGEAMIQWLRAHPVLLEHLIMELQPLVPPAPGDPTPSAGLQGHTHTSEMNTELLSRAHEKQNKSF